MSQKKNDNAEYRTKKTKVVHHGTEPYGQRGNWWTVSFSYDGDNLTHRRFIQQFDELLTTQQVCWRSLQRPQK